MKMNIFGKLTLVKRVRIAGDECWGSTEVEGNKFLIRVAESSLRHETKFADTIVHELLHLALYIICGSIRKDLSTRRHHQIIKVIVPQIIDMLQHSHFTKRKESDKDLL